MSTPKHKSRKITTLAPHVYSKGHSGYNYDLGKLVFDKPEKKSKQKEIDQEPPNAIQTTHNLDFESCVWDINPLYNLFRIGTCEGQWFALDKAYCIIAIINKQPGNGHLDDVFEWFEHSCKRDGKALMVLEFFNDRFKKHCIEKRGFRPFMENDVIKTF